MADGWIYRYDFKNGDCYVGKEGSFDPFIRAAEHLQDALAVAYPGQYTGFKALFRGPKSNYVTINRYSEAKVQKFGWQLGLQGRNNDKGVKFTHQEIEDLRKRSTGRGVSSVYLTVDEDGQYIFEEDRKKAETRGIIEFKKVFLKEGVYKGNDIGSYEGLPDPDPKSHYSELFDKIKNWRYIPVKDMRQLFQVTPAEITWLANTIKKNGGDVTIKEAGTDLIRLLNILFGKTDKNTGERSKTNDWINIFYSEVRKSSEIKGRKAGASLLDVCEMFATLSAYYELGTSKVVNSEGESPEMLNNEIMMASFSSLLAGKQQAVGQAIAESIDLQKALGEKNTLLLKNIIAKLGKEGNKAGGNVKILYKVASSQIASLIARRIRTTNIWSNKGEEQKTEMFKKVFALLTSSPFSDFSKKKYRTSFNNGE